MLLIETMSTPTTPRVLNYDKRARNTPMESQRRAAAIAFKDTMAQLDAVVPTANMEERITLHAVTPYPQVLETTFGREVRLLHSSYTVLVFMRFHKLWFAGLHAIHHWSMVSSGLTVRAAELNGDVPQVRVIAGELVRSSPRCTGPSTDSTKRGSNWTIPLVLHPLHLFTWSRKQYSGNPKYEVLNGVAYMSQISVSSFLVVLCYLIVAYCCPCGLPPAVLLALERVREV